MLAALALTPGCNHHGDTIEVVAETDEKQYQYAEQMLKEDRQAEALTAFERVIAKRGDDAPESHMEAGRLYLKVKNDPIIAIYHFQKYLEAKPNTEQAPMVKGLIDTAKKEFARTLPGQPYHGEYDRLDMLDQIRTLTAENAALRQQLGLVHPALANTSPGQNGIALNGLPPSPSENIATAPLNPANIKGATATTTNPTATAKPGAARTYTVQAGDTLARISTKMYGSSTKWKDIYDANQDQLPSPKALKAGQVLKIP